MDSKPDDDEWVLLRVLLDRAQAMLLAEFLDNQRIPVSVEGAYSAGMLPGVEGVRVMVPADRIDEARLAAKAFDGD
ncbi:MAG: hypothetical protein FWD69_05250 [Polyangiaceae bacterium]|nr:hypothetical protein [Polyangiaceae bacterium]